jgi:ATP-binding cassette subfamily B protein
LKRRFLIPEVVQTSSLDCGPAALQALLDGFGRRVSYADLREACQTGLDGTSIETLEAVANRLGLEAEQIMVPLDHLFAALPAIVVVTLPQGITHFVVAWRCVAGWVQIMDPGVGRRWIRARMFLNDVFVHTMAVDAQDWIEYARSEDFQQVFRARQRALRIRLEVPDGEMLAAQDAAVRLTDALVRSGGVRRGRAAKEMVQRLVERPDVIPRHYWSLLSGELRGAVLVRIKGAQGNPGRTKGVRKNLFRFPVVLMIPLLAAAVGAFVEALLFRALLDVNGALALAGQRMAAWAAVVIFCAALLLLELPAFVTGARLGRMLEIRLRRAFLEKIPKLSDRYLQSRALSDMAERSHILHRLRHVPDQMRQLILACSQLVVTACGIVWLDPAGWPFVLGSLGAALIPFFSSRWILAERDLRVRTHSGGLMRFYVDAMLGLMPIRAHGAAESLTRQHGLLLEEWTRASFRLQRAIVMTEGLQLSIMFCLVAALLVVHPLEGIATGRVLLMAYWALNLPALGQEIAVIARQYPNYRSIALRLMEPLGAPEEVAVGGEALQEAPVIEFRNVSVVASGTTILRDVSARIAAGSDVAIVGSSGAGKSTLVGLLLGWARASSGEVLVDGRPIDVEEMRLSSAWVDPSIQLWNETLHSNLLYGGDGRADFAEVIDSAALRHVLEALPQGLQTVLGENGGLVSGGEGQRVRLGRALQRRDAKVVILDEPFRGLDREKRTELLGRAREYWSGATLLCVTHDIAETLDFCQVLVVEGGTVVEAGPPKELAANLESRYAGLLVSERQARERLWGCEQWRRIELRAGLLA